MRAVAERIVFPDAQAVVIGAVRSGLPSLAFPDVSVGRKIPNPRPNRFVRVLRTGGPRRAIVIDSAQMTVEAWSNDPAEAHDLAQAARAIVNSMAGTVQAGVIVANVDEFSGPADLPDPESGQARYTWTVSVNTRGVAA